MSEAFVALEDALLAPPPGARETASVDREPVPEPEVQPESRASRDLIRAERIFRAALADALEVELARILPAIARDVVARELELKPADVAAVASAALERYAHESIVRVRAHADDVAALAQAGVAAVADESVRRGGVLVEVRSGTIDVSVEARLDELLADAAA
jgi:flagellar biosynthesis/type III secretory pathway protein FliH